MEILLLSLSPFVVALVSQGVKKLVGKRVFSAGFRKSALRFAVAALSYGSVVGAGMISGVEVDLVATETFVNSLVIFLGSTGTYYLSKK